MRIGVAEWDIYTETLRTTCSGKINVNSLIVYGYSTSNFDMLFQSAGGKLTVIRTVWHISNRRTHSRFGSTNNFIHARQITRGRDGFS